MLKFGENFATEKKEKKKKNWCCPGGGITLLRSVF
jgi:hypothetical protein